MHDEIIIMNNIKKFQIFQKIVISDIISNFRFKSNTPSGRRNSNVTVKSTKSNNEKFTETEITWSENTDRLIQ